MLLENPSARVFAILQAIFKGMASHGLPPSRSASPFSSGSNLSGLNGLSKIGLVRPYLPHGMVTLNPEVAHARVAVPRGPNRTQS